MKEAALTKLNGRELRCREHARMRRERFRTGDRV